MFKLADLRLHAPLEERPQPRIEQVRQIGPRPQVKLVVAVTHPLQQRLNFRIANGLNGLRMPRGGVGEQAILRRIRDAAPRISTYA